MHTHSHTHKSTHAPTQTHILNNSLVLEYGAILECFCYIFAPCKNNVFLIILIMRNVFYSMLWIDGNESILFVDWLIWNVQKWSAPVAHALLLTYLHLSLYSLPPPSPPQPKTFLFNVCFLSPSLSLTQTKRHKPKKCTLTHIHTHTQNTHTHQQQHKQTQTGAHTHIQTHYKKITHIPQKRTAAQSNKHTYLHTYTHTHTYTLEPTLALSLSLCLSRARPPPYSRLPSAYTSLHARHGNGMGD